MRIAIRHLEVFDDLALIPNVIAGSEHFNAEVKKLLSKLWSNAEAGSSVFAVGNDQVNVVLLHQLGQAFAHDSAAGASENVANKKNFH